MKKTKRSAAFVLALVSVLLMSMFAGCSGAATDAEHGAEESGKSGGLFSREPDPLRVCIDLDAFGTYSMSCSPVMESYLEFIGMMGGPKDTILESIPREGTARETAIQRIRTEIMAGEGPDVFILHCEGGINGGWEEPLFPIPEKILEIGLFLPLDDYIENAQFMEWDKQTEIVMAAGRNKYGQQILPLSYTLPLTFYLAEDLGEYKPSNRTDWNDMLKDESGVLTAAATWFHAAEDRYKDDEGAYLEYVFGEVADYESEELLFTEEELLLRTTEVLDLRTAYKSGKYDEIGEHYQTVMSSMFNLGKYDVTMQGDPYTMIPIYSINGGATASVASFAAINANTKRPEDAFYILDYLMSYSSQRYADIYDYLANYHGAIPVYEGLMQEEQPISGGWYMSDVNYTEFVRVRDQIKHVRFRGGLAIVLEKMFEECKDAYEAGEDYAPIVSEYYRKMQIMLRE